MERWIEHYSSAQKILLIGKGDFFFSACWARAFGSPTNMVATSLESQASLSLLHKPSSARMNLMLEILCGKSIYRSCASHLGELKRRGCLVLHDAGVYDMDRHDILKWWKFDVIIFNFPHAEHYPWLRERANELIQMHRSLLTMFFESAHVMLNYGGEVYVTTRNDYPYNTWNVEQLAGLFLREKMLFEKSDYPGYQNKRGGSIRSNRTFRPIHCWTFKFSLQQDYSSADDDQMSVCSDATSSCSYYMY